MANITLSSSASSITFSNIPNTYRDLILVTNMKANDVNEGYIELNNSSANFSWVRMYGASTGAISSTSTSNNLIPTITGTGHHIVQFMDYSATDKHKTMLINMARSSDSFIGAYAARWANTAAITSIKLLPTGGFQFQSGFTAALYGVIA